MTISFAKTIPPPEGDLNRNVSGRTGVVSGAYRRTRDRVQSAAALQRDQQENQPQITIADDWYGRMQARWKAEAEASEREKQARTQAQIDRMKADEQRQRVIAEQINFLCEQCGFTVEQATEHVTGRKM